MEITWTPYATGGFIPVTPKGKARIAGEAMTCKEVFARRMMRENFPDGIMHFLRRDARNMTEEKAHRQQQVLRVFEKAMNIRPLAKVEMVSQPDQKYYDHYYSRKRVAKGKKFFLYTVSESWKRSIPLLHILALLVRNYTPSEVPLNYKSILEYYAGKRGWPVEVIKEVVHDKGEIQMNIPHTEGGISSYGRGLARERKVGHEQAVQEASLMDYDNWDDGF